MLLVSSVLLVMPNAAHQVRLEADARHERTL
jgi:predicted deacetylase